MNNAGWIMRDRTWSLTAGNTVLTAQSGVAEDFKSDCKGRIVQRRTKSWGSPLNVDKNGQGLIYFYNYPDQCGTFDTSEDQIVCTEALGCLISTEPPKDCIAEGTMEGRNGTPMYIRSVERGIADRPELITKEIRFRNPSVSSTISNDDDTNAEVTVYEYGFNNALEDKPIVYKQTKHPKAPRAIGEAEYYLVERTTFNANGNRQWYGVGTLFDPSGGVSGTDEFIAGLSNPGWGGLPMEVIADCDYTNTTTFVDDGCAHPNFPLPTSQDPRFMRHAPGEALNYRTHYYHGGQSIPTHVLLPNKRQTWRYNVDAPSEGGGINSYNEWYYSDLVVDNPVDPNIIPCIGWGNLGDIRQGDFRVLAPAKVTHYENGKVMWIKMVRKDRINSLPFYGDNAINAGELISTSVAGYDDQGRFVGMVMEGETDGASMAAQISFDGFGQVGRQQDVDGTITRKTYDEKGRLENTYRGTDDYHSNWGAGDCPPENPIIATPTT